MGQSKLKNPEKKRQVGERRIYVITEIKKKRKKRGKTKTLKTLQEQSEKILMIQIHRYLKNKTLTGIKNIISTRKEVNDTSWRDFDRIRENFVQKKRKNLRDSREKRPQRVFFF